MNKNYNLKLDLQFRCNNSIMKFNQFDNETSDFFIRITNGGKLFDIEKAIVVLAVIKPNKEVDSQFVEVENGVVYANLKPSMKDEIGIYTARAMLILESEKVVTDIVNYEVEEDKIFNLLNDTVVDTEKFTLLTDMLSRLSTIELNENNREETFNNIKDEFEIIKNNHNELVTTETDNKVTELLGPVVSKANEKINEVDNKIVDIENAISEADSKINNAIAKIPPKSELIGEKGDKGEKGEKGDKGDRGEQGLQGIQGIQGIQGERGLQGIKGDKGDKGEQGIQGLKGDKGDKGDRGEQGVKGDTPSITHLETSINNKIQEVETRFNTLTSSQQQSSEVIDARDGEASLKARLDRDIEKAKQIYVNVEGSNISIDSSSGYAKDVEILGNTIQSASNLADIRSVGDKVEGQELYEIPVLSVGKNLFCHPNTTLPSEISYDKETQIYILNGTWSGHKKVYIGDMLKAKKGDSISVTVEVLGGSTTNNNGLIVGGYNERDGKTSWAGSSPRINTSDVKVYTNTQILDRDGCDFITFWVNLSATFNNFKIRVMFEKNTQATPYEPYQEDKITILSPTPLEKVGNVRDRIIEKDGVWGVEKNVNTVVLNGSESWRTDPATDNMINMWFSCENIKANTIMLCDKFNYESLFNYRKDKECIGNNNNNVINLALAKSRLVTPDAQGFKQWLQNNNVLVKYQTTQPQFIPLPHDQQIKLRTFANKTNISFGCEIEGTIKAQVPKSLGATVNTHTEQINNLNKELDRVKKLEESTVSTVTTESDFTTVEATSNGYFEDVKLEGKTLVNLWVNKTKTFGTGVIYSLDESLDLSLLKPSVEYTIVILDETSVGVSHISYTTIDLSFIIAQNLRGDVVTFTTPSEIDTTKKATLFAYPKGGVFTEGDESKIKFILLEGDHTQNPPSYFEGLKSVGQGTDEIVVSSVKGDGNLFDVDKIVSNYPEYFKCNDYIKYQNGGDVTYLKQDFEPNTQYSFTIKASSSKPTNLDFTCRYTDNTFDRFIISNTVANTVHTQTFISAKGKTIKSFGSFYSDSSIITLYLDGTCINKGDTPKPYTPHQADKKRLLYYNEETQTWEKPILREWDSIEKHANGKYYYHQRSAEVVLNGSENWIKPSSQSSNTSRFLYAGFPNNSKTKIISTMKIKANASTDEVGIWCDTNTIINTSLDITTVEELKQSLQTNNVTVVYQLAQEKVYECTNIDLITYVNETNYIVKCGAIVPRTTLKVHNNISNVVSLLQKKVSLLESNITNYMITQNRMQLASTYSADSVTFKVDYFSLCGDEENYDEDLYNLILNNILVGKDNYDYDKMFTMILDYASWNQISWEQFDILVGLMDMQHNPPVEELPTEDIIEEDVIENEETPVVE